jgi:cytochrome b6-f complex iron-sulfur subunit
MQRTMSDPNPNITNEPGTPPPDKPAAPAPSPVAAAPKPATPAAAPPKPAAKPAAKGDSRRGFITWFVGAWIAFIGAMLVQFLGTLRFLMPNITDTPGKVKVGFPDNFEEGKVEEKFKDKNMWIVKDQGKIYALSTTCTHLGCTPNWLEREQKFKCPCHGSGFYKSGINFEGPAPRPLERWAVAVGDDGQVVVDKSKKFQEERGEWENPESFIKV